MSGDSVLNRAVTRRAFDLECSHSEGGILDVPTVHPGPVLEEPPRLNCLSQNDDLRTRSKLGQRLNPFAVEFHARRQNHVLLSRAPCNGKRKESDRESVSGKDLFTR